MDPLTHALTGALAASLIAAPRMNRRALVMGAVAGLLPDLDILIRSAADPLLTIEHHRGFTHSLIFAPVGGAIASLPFARTWRAALAATLAWLTHELLDAATTYGTQLFWPFSRYRVGLDIISIIDPLFTLIALAGVIAAAMSRRRGAQVAIGLLAAWLAIGAVQRERALAAQATLANRRGETPQRRAVFPTIGNTLVWRSIYRTGDVLRMDRIRVPWLGGASYAQGDAVIAAKLPAHATERMQRDFARFAWFSDHWIARHPSDATIIGDARYSRHSTRYDPVWGIRFQPGRLSPTEWVDRTRQRQVSSGALWRELTGRSADFQSLD